MPARPIGRNGVALTYTPSRRAEETILQRSRRDFVSEGVDLIVKVLEGQMRSDDMHEYSLEEQGRKGNSYPIWVFDNDEFKGSFRIVPEGERRDRSAGETNQGVKYVVWVNMNSESGMRRDDLAREWDEYQRRSHFGL